MDPLSLLLQQILKDQREMNGKIDKLLAFHWKMIGMATATSIITTAIVQVGFFFLKGA